MTFTLLLSEFSNSFYTVCRAFSSTEEADADAVRHHSGQISSESTTPVSCVKWLTEGAQSHAAQFCVNNIKLTENGWLVSLKCGDEVASLSKKGFCLTNCNKELRRYKCNELFFIQIIMSDSLSNIKWQTDDE